MNSKWYIAIVVIFLAAFGIGWEPVTSHNQEIVVQFQGGTAPSEAQEAIVLVKEQLQAVGVHDVLVNPTHDGMVKITYYSTVAVARMQQLLAANAPFNLGITSREHEQGPSHFPAPEQGQSYKLDVFELHQDSDVPSGFNGCAVDMQTESDRFFNPHVYFLQAQLPAHKGTNDYKVAYLAVNRAALFFDKHSYKIPEVRAGPQA